MKRFGFLVLAVCLLGVGCDDDDTAAPSGRPAVFSALLSPSNEVPAVGNAENSGRGAVQVSLTTTTSGGAITAATASFHVQLFDYPAGTRVQGAHIHTGGAGVNGPIRVDTGLTAGSPLVLTDGTATMDVVGINVDPAVAQAIIDNPEAWYFNVHSPLNPGGFSRGQLSRVQ
jgi:hypothetical protein